MDIALVTGADAGPGLAIARRLIGMGCRVYALAKQFTRNPFPHDDFITLPCDLADPAAVTLAAEQVLAREGHVTFVVHAARREPTPLFDTPVADLAARVNTGLLAPLALARSVLPSLRAVKGHFLILCWDGSGPAPGGPVTAAIEGGLHHFAEQLFEELRDDGVRATTIYARPNPDASPEAAMSLDPQSAVNPELVADAVEHLIRLRPSNSISTLVVRPSATTESPRIPRSAELAGIATREIQLPPRQNFPREPEPIPTPRRERPADAPPPGAEGAGDDADDEEDDWDPRLEPLPWAPKPEETSGSSQENRPPPQGQGQPPRDFQRPRSDDRYQQGDRGRGGRGGRGQRGGRGRGGRDRFDDRPPQREPLPRPPADFSPADAPPVGYDDDDGPAGSRTRDESFRTPHSEDEAGAPNPDTDFEAPARDDAPGDTREGAPQNEPRRDSEEQSYEPAHASRPPQREQSREPSQRPPQRPPQRPQQDDRQRPRENPQAQAQRRHRRYGRRPPPGGGMGRGPDAD